MMNPDATRFETRSLPEGRLLVFSRVPEPGAVKSRIAEQTGEALALELYRAMIGDLLANIGDSDDRLLIEIVWTSRSDPDPAVLRTAFGEHRLVRQEGRDLGERLATAFNERIYIHRTSKVIAIGTDLPSLTRHDIDTALSLLDSCEWVLGPAADGGYYLIGCRADAYFPALFDGIAWGTERVLADTERRLRGLGKTVAQLPERADLDRIEDLDTELDASSAPMTSALWKRGSEASR